MNFYVLLLCSWWTWMFPQICPGISQSLNLYTWNAVSICWEARCPEQERHKSRSKFAWPWANCMSDQAIESWYRVSGCYSCPHLSRCVLQRCWLQDVECEPCPFWWTLCALRKKKGGTDLTWLPQLQLATETSFLEVRNWKRACLLLAALHDLRQVNTCICGSMGQKKWMQVGGPRWRRHRSVINQERNQRWANIQCGCTELREKKYIKILFS